MNETLLHQITQLLTELQSHDNTKRSQAEESLDQHWLTHLPMEFLFGLSTLIVSAHDSQVIHYYF